MFTIIRRHFLNFSLTQQALLLCIFTLVFLLGFFFLFLGENVSVSTANEMYNMLEVAQHPIVSLVEEGDPIPEIELFIQKSNSGQIQNVLYTRKEGQLISYGLDGSNKSEIALQLQPEVLSLMDYSYDATRQNILKTENTSWYWRMSALPQMNQDAVLLSFMDSTYALQLQNTVLNSAVYLTFLAFLIVLAVFLFWVYSIIHPLNQLKSFITRIKEGKDVDLQIDRKDEIGEIGNELRILRTELEKQEKAKEEMIHNISHDLKTPIATIKSYAESIKDGIYPYGSLESSLDVILDNSQRLEKKVHNLLYMNRVEYLLSTSGQDAITDMEKVVEEVVQNVSMIRPEVTIKTFVQSVNFSGQPESWRVTLENLLDNAFRYARSMIIIQVTDDELAIYNDGSPIEEDQQASLFQPYVKGKGGRFGLGLSIVHKIVSFNGYQIEVKNVPGGVCFHIFRPHQKYRKRMDLRKIRLEPRKNDQRRKKSEDHPPIKNQEKKKSRKRRKSKAGNQSSS